MCVSHPLALDAPLRSISLDFKLRATDEVIQRIEPIFVFESNKSVVY